MARNDSFLPFVEQIRDEATRNALRQLAGKLDSLGVQVAGPTRGTIDPDQKPAGLGTRDAGTLFYSTDYDRTYQWTGTIWQDAIGSAVRGQVTFFPPDTDPGTGWAQADGSLVAWSTSDGRTENRNVPSIPSYSGQVPWVRL